MANKEAMVTIIARGGATAEWESKNPVLANREIGVEELADGRRKMKIGDGATAWIDLAYATADDLADLNEDATHRTVTDAEKAAWNAKQNALTFDDAPTADSSNPVKSSGIATALAGKANKDEIPDVSEFITRAVNDLVSYYTKTQIDGKVSELEGKITAIPKFAISVVTALPTSGQSATTLYLLKTSESETGNLYTEYIYVNGAWESLGTQTLDFSGYATTDWVNTQIADFLTESAVTTLINNALAAYVKTAELAAIAKSGKLADATEDATHRVVTDTEKAAWNAKQNALSFDTAPTAGSTNPVTSGGVKTALDAKANTGDIVKASTGLTDSADIMRYSDTLTINGGGV